MSYPDGMLMRSNDSRSPYFRSSPTSNYSDCIDRDSEIVDEIRDIIRNAEMQINARLSRVTDIGAFDTDEIGCLFENMSGVLPTRIVLEARAGL